MRKRVRKLLACVLVVCLSLNMLGVSAFAAEAEAGGTVPVCGKTEHHHSAECYGEPAVICGLEENEGHRHTAECGEGRTLVCELEEGEDHTHTDECYSAEVRTLTCGLEESAGHTHTEECSPVTARELACGKEETEGHTHTEDCYTVETALTCEIPEGELEEAEGHTHTDECWTETTTYGCGLEESAGHTHTDACYTVTSAYTCGLEEREAHTHTNECYKLQCTTPEHTHDPVFCYDAEGNLICEEEEHTHGDTCYLPLICGMEEHTHSDECYETELPEDSEISTIGNMGPFTSNTLDTNNAEYTVDGYVELDNSLVVTGQNVTITGSGTIDASKISGNTEEASAIIVRGGTLTITGNVTIQGGKGTNMKDSDMEPRGDNTFKVGGGVYVEKGTLNLTGGIITENTAQRGGGIFVNKGAHLEMTGGSVSSNSTVNKDKPGNFNYAGEGGGIFVWGTAKISGGSITGNICNSTTDLGGGGLYINNAGYATLVNALVTGNTADGWGGGIAGCCHGESSLVATDGVALYDNTAKGTSYTHGQGAKSDATAEIIDHHASAKSQGITGANSSDMYTAGAAAVSNYMSGGGSAKYHVKSKSENRDIKDSEVVIFSVNDNVALKANPSEDAKAKAEAQHQVIISGNSSTVHGGGIGCNGGLSFGASETSEENFYVLSLELDALKELKGGNMALNAGDYTFELVYNDKQLATAQNDSSGKIKFSIIDYSVFGEINTAQTYTFTMREILGNKTDIIYDQISMTRANTR